MKIQLGMAMWGFFIRGAVTIGEVYHDDRSVFGPALVWAYELESKVAQNPRIIIDPDIAELRGLSGPITSDGNLEILDPFTIKFIDRTRLDANPQKFADFLRENNGNLEALAPSAIAQTPQMYLFIVMHHLSEELRRPLNAKSREKLEWLYDRLARRVGVGVGPDNFRLF